MVNGFYRLGHDAVVGSHHQNGNVGTHGAPGPHGGKGGVAGGIQEGDEILPHPHGVCANVLGNPAGLTGNHIGFPDGVQQAGFAMVYVAHDHHHRAAGLQLLGGVHMVVNELLFNGDGDLPFYPAAHLRGHKLCGVKVNVLIDGGHYPIFQQGFDDLRRRLLHPAGQFAYRDLIRDFYRQGRFLNHFQAQAAHFLLLFAFGFAALELAALFVALGLPTADFLLAAGEVLHPLGYQGIHPVVKPLGIHPDGGGIHHPALPAALRLLGSGGAFCRLGFGGLPLSGFGLRLAGLILPGGRLLGPGGLAGVPGRFRLGLLGGGKHLLQGSNLVVLGNMVKKCVQLLVGEHLAVTSGPFRILAHNIGHFFGGHT